MTSHGRRCVKLQFIWIKIANNPLNTLHYLQKAHLSSDTKPIDLADINIYDASVHTDEPFATAAYASENVCLIFLLYLWENSYK